jgi:DNA-binding XRE family transcriptional regulator
LYNGQHEQTTDALVKAFEKQTGVIVKVREALAFGKARYDRRLALGLGTAELAERAGMTTDEIECIEEGGAEPTIALLRHLAAALDADARLTPGHDLGSAGFEAHAA